MSRVRPPAAICLLFCLCIALLTCVTAVVAIDDSEENFVYTELDYTHPIRTYYNVAIPVNNASITSKTNVDINLTILPKSIVQDFTSKGWKLYVTGDDINNDNDKDYFITGRIQYDKKYIILESTKTGTNCSTVTHEFGHYIDYMNGYSKSKKFMNIYNSEEYYTVDNCNLWTLSANEPSELFAESYSIYLCANDWLKTYCPNLYAYFEDISASF